MERRTYTRRAAWFPVTLELPTGQIWGISRDVSPGGLMVSTAVQLSLGDSVGVLFRLSRKDADRRAIGRILRCWRNEDELHLAFPFRMAIQFEQPVADLDSIPPPAG